MLKTRVITALLLLAVFLPALFAASPWPFAGLTVAMIGAAMWEWSRLNGAPGKAAVLFGLAVAALCAWLLIRISMAMQPPPPWVWWLVSAVWVLGGAYALRVGPTGWPKVSPPLRRYLGVLVLLAAWLAMVQAKLIGINFLLSIFCLVWMADIAAYFGGKAFGKRKLAPAISPGKSWEGVGSGMAGVLLLGLVWCFVIDVQFAVDSPSLYQVLLRQHPLFIGLLALLLLSCMSVVGDLFESLIKRAAGAKDSSQLLPGHGGVLDRIDALLPVFPLAMALVGLR